MDSDNVMSAVKEASRILYFPQFRIEFFLTYRRLALSHDTVLVASGGLTLLQVVRLPREHHPNPLWQCHPVLGRMGGAVFDGEASSGNACAAFSLDLCPNNLFVRQKSAI